MVRIGLRSGTTSNGASVPSLDNPSLATQSISQQDANAVEDGGASHDAKAVHASMVAAAEASGSKVRFLFKIFIFN